MKNTALIICILIIIAGVFYIMNIPTPEPEIHIETVWDTETTWVDVDPIIITKYVPKLVWDTLKIWDTLYITEVAEMDTSFKEGDLFIQYFLEPQLFKLEWNPKPLPIVTNTITNTVYLAYDPAWYETRTAGFIAGSSLTGFLVWLIK
jgi:hypothetical protein